MWSDLRLEMDMGFIAWISFGHPQFKKAYPAYNEKDFASACTIQWDALDAWVRPSEIFSRRRHDELSVLHAF